MPDLEGVEFHPEAVLELEEALYWYDQQDVPGLALRFAQEVQRVVHLISEHPEIGRRWGLEDDEDVRRFPTSDFPFHVVYTARVRLVVLAIAHQRRRPVYWLHRADDDQG